MSRPALHGPGRKHAHDDFEEIWVEVLHQERLAQTIARLDAAIERDESQARRQTPSAQATPRRTSTPNPPARTKPRARRRRSNDGVRDERPRKDDKPDHHSRAVTVAGVFILCSAALSLAIAGGIFLVLLKAWQRQT